MGSNPNCSFKKGIIGMYSIDLVEATYYNKDLDKVFTSAGYIIKNDVSNISMIVNVYDSIDEFFMHIGNEKMPAVERLINYIVKENKVLNDYIRYYGSNDIISICGEFYNVDKVELWLS